MSRNFDLPHGKRLHVYRSGDPSFKGKQVHYNPRLYRTLDGFLNELSEKVPTVGAVRSIHTPNTGTLITSLSQLENRNYVAAGFRGFTSIPGGYESIGHPKSQVSNGKSKVIRRPGPKHRSLTIHVHRNGDMSSQARRMTLDKTDVSSWTQLIGRLNAEPNFAHEPISSNRGGYAIAYRLYTPNGRLVSSENSIENEGVYVAATPYDGFQHLPYTKNPSAQSKQRSLSDIQPSKSVSRESSRHSVHSSQLNETKSSGKSSRSRQGSNSSLKSKKPNEISDNKEGSSKSYDRDSGYSGVLTPPHQQDDEEQREQEEIHTANDDQGYDEELSTDQTDHIVENDEEQSGYLIENKDIEEENEEEEEEGDDDDDDEEEEDNNQEETEEEEILAEHYDSNEAPENAIELVGDDEELNYLNSLQEYQESIAEEEEPASESYDEEVTSFFAKIEEPKEALLQSIREESDDDQDDSGHTSLLSDVGYNSPYYAREKSRPTTQAMQINYDEDTSGFFRAKSRTYSNSDAATILESSITKIDLPIDMLETKEVEEMC